MWGLTPVEDVPLGVLLAVADTVWLGVCEGVKETVYDADGVCEGVKETVALGEGVKLGVKLTVCEGVNDSVRDGV